MATHLLLPYAHGTSACLACASVREADSSYCRERRQAEGRLYGASILAIGLAATAYHATSGKLRTAFRKADYWTISLSSVAMTKALHPERMQNRWAKVASAASLAAIPFQPTLVTACHAAAMEVSGVVADHVQEATIVCNKIS